MRFHHVAVLAALLPASVTYADTLTFQQGDGGAYSETAATSIHLGIPWANYGTSGVLTVITYEMQALIRFPDILGSNAGQIPPGSSIASASLTLTMYGAPILPAPTNIHGVTAPWDENTVTAENFYSQPGELYGPAVGSIPTHDPYGVVTGDLTPIAQGWANGGADWGVMLRLETPPTPEEGFYVTQYYSDDAPEPSWRPRLTVEFTPPATTVETSTWGRVKALYR
jgi:hypothetical protein